MEDGKIRVLVVDDHLITRSFFEGTVRSSSGYALAASLASAQEAVVWCRTHSVDLIILDVLMKSGIDGLAAARIIKREHPEVRIILTTSTAEARWLEEAREIGAEAFWFKNYGDTPLLEIMDRTMAGERNYVDVTADIRLGQATRGELTEREMDVLRELISCAPNEQIAEHLGVSLNTVKTHIRHLLEKTGFTDRLELAINASKTGIVVSDRELANPETR